MADDDHCQFCGAQDSWRHALVDCNLARSVWALADEELTEHIQCSAEGDAREWIASLISTLKHSEQTRVFVTLWAIWHARRKAIHENIFQSPLSVHFFVQNLMAELSFAESSKDRRARVNTPMQSPAWIPPPSGVIKINVHAAMGKNTRRGSVAAVARDDSGKFVGASAVVLSGQVAAETVEALACREAIALARDINARRVRVASDCSNVIASIEEGTRGVYALITMELRDAKRDFEELSFCHERRGSNKEPHSLAKFVVSDDLGRQVWFLSPPDGVCIPMFVS
jgi:ribonuclease HI